MKEKGTIKSFSSPLFAYSDGYIQTGVDQTMNKNTHIYPTKATIHWGITAFLPSRTIERYMARTVSSTMIPAACVQKKRIAPDCFQVRPCATSLKECSRPDKRKVRNRRVYFDGSIPLGRRSTELAMKFAGLDIFCCWYLCQNSLHTIDSVLCLKFSNLRFSRVLRYATCHFSRK